MKRTLPILVFALGWLACSGFGLGTGAKVSESERLDYANALSLLAEDPAAGEQRLLDFVQAWPRSPLSGDASLRLAEMALARGDQLVHVYVEVPTRLNARQRELLEQLAEESGGLAAPASRGFLEKLRDIFE